MKTKNLIGLGIALICLTACKKEKPSVEPEPVITKKIDPLELLRDSISYTIDGKQLIQRRSEGRSGSIINDIANAKLDSLVKYQEYKSGDKDSVMFGRGFHFVDENRNSIEIQFLKKYNRNQAQPKTNQTAFFIPSDKLDLFSTGEKKFALDFTRNNSQNGITLELNGEYYGLQTYGYSSLFYQKPLSQELQKDSKFEIIKLQKLESGKYLLEAKFNASVYRADGTNLKKIENGYLRLKLNPEYIYF